MLMTPLTAFAPQTVAPGPRITSIRAMSSMNASCTSQKTPEKQRVYRLRPSISTRSLLAVVPLKPRALIECCRQFVCARRSGADATDIAKSAERTQEHEPATGSTWRSFRFEKTRKLSRDRRGNPCGHRQDIRRIGALSIPKRWRYSRAK